MACLEAVFAFNTISALRRMMSVTFLVDYSYKNKDGFFISEISVIVALFHKSFVVSPSIGISIIVHVTSSPFCKV